MFKILFDGIKDEVGYETDYYQILLEARSQFKKIGKKKLKVGKTLEKP